MKQKAKEILGVLTLFGLLTYLGRNAYLLEWLARRYFCFVWVPILVLWALNQEVLARWLTAGAFLGLFAGQIAEDLKKILLPAAENPAADSSYWGVGTWFTTVLAAAALGWLHSWILKKAALRKQAKLQKEKEKQEAKAAQGEKNAPKPEPAGEEKQEESPKDEEKSLVEA